MIEEPKDTESIPYIPKTDLGKNLSALRNSAIANGMPLMTDEEISEGNDAPKITYVARCPVCHTKIEWDESGTQLAVQTPAELAAENALCNAAYLAKKPE